MPRSKREKEVSLTRVKKKTKETKAGLVGEVRKAVDDYPNVFVFTIENMRSTKFVQVRQKFKTNSRFFFGKNNVLGVALGKDANDEYAKGLNKVSQLLKGQCGLMFTSVDKDEVIQYFKELRDADFARAGAKATQTIELPEGPLPQFSFSLEPQLRKLGLPTKLDKGAICLTQSYVVCKEGEVLNAEAAKILKLLDERQAEFQVVLRAYWNKKTGLKDLV